MEYFDNIGNKIDVGDEILILVPKTYKTYRKGIVKDFRNAYSIGIDHFYCEVLVEYDDGRLYCNEFRWDQHNNIKFNRKLTKAWRVNSDIIKFKPEYINL